MRVIIQKILYLPCTYVVYTQVVYDRADHKSMYRCHIYVALEASSRNGTPLWPSVDKVDMGLNKSNLIQQIDYFNNETTVKLLKYTLGSFEKQPGMRNCKNFELSLFERPRVN